MKQINLRNSDSKSVAALGQGTWHMGMDKSKLSEEADAIRYGIDLGMTLIDTAEMYHDAELVVAKAIKGHAQEVFIVSKVLPGNASKSGTIAACERSLRRLEVECMDLYLLHWASQYPLEETLEAFEMLVQQGKICNYGVSNFDTSEMESAFHKKGGTGIVTNQILYNLESRGVEWDLLPWCSDKGIPIMAYSPLNQGRLDFHKLDNVAQRHEVDSTQIALAWLLHQHNVIVIPKSSDRKHVRLNFESASIRLSKEDMAEIESHFPGPQGPKSLQML